MTSAEGHWYTSPGFWSPTSGIIAAILICGVTIWVQIRVAYPKWRLYYALLPGARLLSSEFMIDVQARHPGKTPAQGYFWTLVFENVGRRSITRAAFDGAPLQFDVSEQVIECLNVQTYPDDEPKPQVTIDGSMVAIGPVKMGKGAAVFVSVLLGGTYPNLRKPVQSLTDVEIRPRPKYDRRYTSAPALMMMSLMLGALVDAAFVTVPSGAHPTAWTTAVFVALAVGALLAFSKLTWLVLTRWWW